MKQISEQVLELRYKPNPKILDHRGAWAEGISSFMGLSEWRILDNRVDAYSKNAENHVFVGFRNMGFVCKDASTKNYFYEQAIKLLNYLKNLPDFGQQPYIERLGVRTTLFRSFDGDFDTLRDRYTNRFLNLSKDAQQIFNAKLIDIGAPLNFADDIGNFNTISGPMEKKQLVEMLQRKKEDIVPDVGFYFDADYWVKPDKNLKIEEINSKIKQFSERSWDRYEKLFVLVTKS